MESANDEPPPPPPAAPCLTCGSLTDCFEDIDHLGDFYCASCWAAYEHQLLLLSAGQRPMLLEEDETSENRGGQDGEEAEGAYSFSTQPLASQPCLSTTQENDDNNRAKSTETSATHSSAAEAEAAAAVMAGGAMDQLCGSNEDSENSIDNVDATETVFSIDYNDTAAHGKRKDDEMMSDLHCLLTQAAADDNGNDDEKHDTCPNYGERIIHDEEEGFAEKIINSHQRKVNQTTDQSPVMEAVMTTNSDAHGDNVALSGLTEPTSQPDLSLLPTNENRPDSSFSVKVRESLPRQDEVNILETKASSSAVLPAPEMSEAPFHSLPNNDDRYDDVVKDDGSSAYNGLSEIEEEEEEGTREVRSFAKQANNFANESVHELECTEIASKGKQQTTPTPRENDGNAHMELTRRDVIIDNNMHIAATADIALTPSTSQRYQQDASVDVENEDENISSSDTEMEENAEHNEEGTGDTNVTFGSGYWSLYDGNTQKLPTEPSQVVHDASAVDSDGIQNSVVEAQIGEPPIVSKTCINSNDLGTEATSLLPSTNSDADNAKDSENKLILGDESDDAQEVEQRIANMGDDNCLEEISHPVTRERSPMLGAPRVEDVGEDETQMSQDLLSSPAAKSNQFDQLATPVRHTVAVQKVPKNLSPSSNLGRNSTTSQEFPEQTVGTKTEITSATKLISIQNHSVDQAEWLPSARNLSGPKDRVPLLLMPTPKPQQKSKVDDPIEPPLDDSAGSDTLSWSGHGHNYDDHAIDDTQHDNDARHPSAFKRLSREYSTLRKYTSSKSSPVTKRKSKSKTGGETSIMKPKILRYNALTKVDYDSSKSAGSSSSSEAEFDDDDNVSTKRNDDHQKSQTDQRIRKQLEEVKAILPSVKEIQDIASRKQLIGEIVELKKSYHETVTKLKREKSKLVAQLKIAEETICQKDKVIREKNALLDEQFKVIEQIKQACGVKLPTQAECKHPIVKTNSKRKNESLPDHSSNYETDEDEDSDLPLSALRNTNGPSSNKKQRKSPVSSRTSAQTNKRRLSPTSSARTQNSDTVSADIPLNVASKSMSTVQPRLANDNSRVLAPDVWRKLQEKGWRYQTGPEPHNKVYVPKDGATHAGTQLGIHFFDSDQVIAAAIERGDLTYNCSESTSEIHPGQPIQLVQDGAETKPISDTFMDDTKFCGTSNLLTLESARTCIDILVNFVRKNDHERFVGIFFTPLWQRLKDQGAGPEMNWRYDANRNPLAKCSWCFVPPSSNLGGKGKAGYDYFETEEQVALAVLKEVRTVQELKNALADRDETFSVVFPVLERAVEENLDYVDAKRGTSGSVRARRATSKLMYSPNSSPFKQPQKTGAKEDLVTEKAQKSSSKKPISKITPESKLEKNNASTLNKVSKSKPTFHMSQTQGVEAILPSFNRCSPRQDLGPLTGLNFFFSGIDSSFTIGDRIRRLGGKVVDYNSLTVESSYRRTFFLADYTCWRKLKYILANSLGVPMLHFQWVAEIEQKCQECGTAKPFDSELFKKYRLPLGLDLSHGVFPLQRASNARAWDPPGHTKGAGEKIFQGMTIAVAIEETQVIDWTSILSACGATVKTLSDIQKGKGQINVDCCLLASTSLPPHSVSLPDYVSKLIRCLVDNVPLLDLAWAHQSIIQRKRLPVVGDTRYAISLVQDMRNTSHVSSIKSKAGARYEIGDLVQFTLGSKVLSSGRIIDIMFESQGRNCKLEIQLLDSCGDYELIDYPSAAKITVNESSLKGNILMLDTDDFSNLGYIHAQRNIFNRAANDSQI